jgi:ABC-2 type transport system permease protein
MTLLAQVKREFAALFYSPIAYVLLVAAMLINGIHFVLIVYFLSDPYAPHGAAMQYLFGGTIFFYLLLLGVASMITMRSLAEERHSGTIETLLTAPINGLQVVVAKYLASLGFYVVLWIPTLLYPLLLSRHSEIDPGPVIAGYLGTLGVGMMFLAIGMFFSALTRSQIIAALLTLAVNFALFLMPLYEIVSPSSSPDSILGHMNLWNHMEDFGRGIVDTRHLIYYVSVTLFALFCSVQVLQARRWKG